jgi:hypothetical protein
MQMNPLTILNVAANVVLSVSALHLILKVFGHPNSPVYARPFVALLCKAAATLTFIGAVANVWTLSTPGWTEIVLNVGVSCNWAWISAFINTTHKAEKKVAAKPPARPTPMTSKIYKRKNRASDE